MTESLQTQDVKRFLAFNIPGKTPEESLEFYKTHFKEVRIFDQLLDSHSLGL